MHELSLAQAVRDLIEDAARREAFSKVHAVHLEIGALAAVEPEAMRFCFDAVVRGSVAEGARLDIAIIPACGWCTQCAHSVELDELVAVCPRCGGGDLKLQCGSELRLKELEVA